MRNHLAISNLNSDLRDATEAVDNLEQLIIAKAVRTSLMNSMKILAVPPLLPSEIFPKSQYVVSSQSIAVGSILVSVGDSINRIAPYYNASDSYISFEQDGKLLATVAPFSFVRESGLRGVSVSVSSILTRPLMG